MEGMIACRGLNCSKCDAYLPTQTDDNAKRQSVAKKWAEQYKADIQPEHINCDGCLADGKKFFFCLNICELRKCCQEKNNDNCAVCDEYMCDKLEKFVEMAPQVKEALEQIRNSA